MVVVFTVFVVLFTVLGAIVPATVIGAATIVVVVVVTT
jgi:hypothetical protein